MVIRVLTLDDRQVIIRLLLKDDKVIMLESLVRVKLKEMNLLNFESFTEDNLKLMEYLDNLVNHYGYYLDNNIMYVTGSLVSYTERYKQENP